MYPYRPSGLVGNHVHLLVVRNLRTLISCAEVLVKNRSCILASVAESGRTRVSKNLIIVIG